MNHLFYGDNLDVLRKLSDASVDLVYLDPPFKPDAPEIVGLIEVSLVG